MNTLSITLSISVLLAVLLCASLPTGSFAVFCGGNKSHNLIVGRRRPGDALLFFEHPKNSSKFLRVVETYVYFPTKRDPPGNITFIEMYDQKRDGTGACASIVGGGIGQTHLNVHIVSQRNHGLDFVIRAYGFRKWHME